MPNDFPRVTILVPWFGPWRPWINLTLETCRWNPRFHFLFITDQPTPAGAARAANVRFARVPFAEIADRFRTRVRLPEGPRRPYKLCDLKPTYGVAFADYLVDSEFWGFADEDVFWGDLGKFFTAERLSRHDVLTTCRCAIAGQLTLWRNVEPVNRLFEEVPNYRAMAATPKNFALDEIPLEHAARRAEAQGRLRVWREQVQVHDSDAEQWRRWAGPLEPEETARRLGVAPHGPAEWREGRVFHRETGEEFAFFHFMRWKKLWRLPSYGAVPAFVRGWTIDARGIRFVYRERGLAVAAHAAGIAARGALKRAAHPFKAGGEVLRGKWSHVRRRAGHRARHLAERLRTVEI